jgi:hypothetical protein
MGCLLVVCGVAMANPKMGGAFICFYVIGLVMFPRVLEALKRRLTYPRLGTAVLHQEEPKPLIGGIFLFTLAAGVLVALVLALLGRLTTAEWYRWLPVWIGLCLVGAMMHMYSKSGSPRFVVYAVVALGAGFAVGFLRLPGKMDNISVYLNCMGVLWVLSGSAVLLRFLRTHPIATDAHPVAGTEGGHDHA